MKSSKSAATEQTLSDALLDIPSAPILGESAVAIALREFVVAVSHRSEPVLIGGEAGSGKDLVARRIHSMSSRATSDFHRIDLDELTEQEIDETLFDPGGDGVRSGLLRTSRGTVYLAAIEAALPMLEQRLAEFLEKQAVQPRLLLGSRYPYATLYEANLVDSRLLDATNLLRHWVAPLRDHLEDLPALCHYQVWLRTTLDDFERVWELFKSQKLPELNQYPWPGNLDELETVVDGFVRANRKTLGDPELAIQFRHEMQRISREWFSRVESREHEELDSRPLIFPSSERPLN